MQTMLRESPLCALEVVGRGELQRVSLFDTVPGELKQQILTLADAEANPQLRRAMGAMAAMAVADSIGHNFEFLPARDAASGHRDDPWFEYPCKEVPRGKVHQPLNRFQLLQGQWTDDTSMGLCLADSLLTQGGYNG